MLTPTAASDEDPVTPAKRRLTPIFRALLKFAPMPIGTYRLKTIKPAPYDRRTAHIHVDVQVKNTRVVTQMHFEGEKQNETDPLQKRRSAESRETLISRYRTPSGQQERDALVAIWDIVLASG